MADNEQFQTATPATMPASLNVALDELDTLNGSATSVPKPKAQRVKVLHGADGVGTDVSAASPLPVADGAAAAALAALLTELGQKLEAGGEVALSSATLSALETISVSRGAYGYDSGTAAGTVDVPPGARVRYVSLKAAGSAATLTVNGGDTITIPAGDVFDREFAGDTSSGGDVVIGGTVTTYYVEWVS